MPRERQPLVVAVVEDDAGLREAILNLLGSAGIAAHGFGSAEEFLRSRRGRHTACLVLDVQLPGMSGLDLLERIRVRRSKPPAVLITAADEPARRRRGRAPQHRDTKLLRKPFAGEELLRAVRRALGKRRTPDR
jgi:FixJ family two-component response regulator